MAYNARVAQIRGQLGIAHRWHPEDVETIDQLRRELATEKLAVAIQEQLTSCPPLTEQQTARLISLLTPKEN